MADVAVVDTSAGAAPKAYKVPGAQEILPKSVTATFDCSSAAATVMPALQLIAPSGQLMGTYCNTSITIAAGGSADVSWFPGLGGLGSGGAGGDIKSVPLLFGAPDSANGYVYLVNTANVRLLVPAFTTGVNSQWWGVLDVPQDYGATPNIILWVAANDTTGHVSRWIVATKAESTGATWDGALTAETAQNATMSTTAYRPTALTFSLSTTPVAGQAMSFYIERNGANAADTLTVDAVVFKAAFQYTA